MKALHLFRSGLYLTPLLVLLTLLASLLLPWWSLLFLPLLLLTSLYNNLRGFLWAVFLGQIFAFVIRDLQYAHSGGRIFYQIFQIDRLYLLTGMPNGLVSLLAAIITAIIFMLAISPLAFAISRLSQK